MADELRDQVALALKQRSVKKGGSFKLASGLLSDIYVDSKGVTLHAPSLKVLSQLFVREWKKRGDLPSVIAGVSVGGDPLATGIALECLEHSIDAKILLVRKEPKLHGGTEGRAVEGIRGEEVVGRIFMVEDVISTGGSSAKAMRYLLHEKYPVTAIWAILDREMGGSEKLQEEFGIPVQSLFRLSDFS